MKPSPDNIQELYLQSLATLGIHAEDHDIRFVEDNWESPTLGAWGLGWGSMARRYGGNSIHIFPTSWFHRL